MPEKEKKKKKKYPAVATKHSNGSAPEIEKTSARKNVINPVMIPRRYIESWTKSSHHGGAMSMTNPRKIMTKLMSHSRKWPS